MGGHISFVCAVRTWENDTSYLTPQAVLLQKYNRSEDLLN